MRRGTLTERLLAWLKGENWRREYAAWLRRLADRYDPPRKAAEKQAAPPTAWIWDSPKGATVEEQVELDAAEDAGMRQGYDTAEYWAKHHASGVLPVGWTGGRTWGEANSSCGHESTKALHPSSGYTALCNVCGACRGNNGKWMADELPRAARTSPPY